MNLPDLEIKTIMCVSEMFYEASKVAHFNLAVQFNLQWVLNWKNYPQIKEQEHDPTPPNDLA